MTEVRKQTVGKQSIQFEHAVHILSGASIVGKKEGEGPLGKYFDVVGKEDGMFGCQSWEEAESVLQKEAVSMAIGKAELEKWQIRTIYVGDLLAQTIASSFGILGFDTPVYGLYGACATMGEALSLSSMATGKIIDFGLKDSLNMGACMAPAACDTIYQNMMDFNRMPEDYDRIITGDLGEIGQHILFDMLKEKGFDIEKQHMDCGIEIYDKESQDTHAGGSGCGCSAVTFASYILPKIEKGEWKRVLFVPTGALLSKVSYNEGQSVPGIAQAVVVEHC